VIKLADLLRNEPESATLDRPLDHLNACHRRIEDRLATLERAAKVIDSDPAVARSALGSAFRFFESNGLLHTEDEEQSIFPRLRVSFDDQGRELLDALGRQHDQAEALYAEVKQALEGPPEVLRAKVASLVDLYRSHIATEDSTLVPLARRHLSEQDAAEISAEMKRRRGLEA
jgi:hemerythrin-like domain-containing protein